MQRIEWEDPKKKSEAYAYLAKVFDVKKPAVSLAMHFKRDSLSAARMRHVALSELGGRLLADKDQKEQTVRVLNSKGEVEKIVTIK